MRPMQLAFLPSHQEIPCRLKLCWCPFCHLPGKWIPVEEKSPRKMGTQIMKYQFPRPGPPTQHRNIKTSMESKEWDDADSWMFFWVSHPVGNTWHEFEIKASNKNETKFGMDSSTTIGAQKKGWNYQPLSIGRQPLRFRFQGFRRHETWWNPAQVGPGPLPSTGTVKKIRS